MYRFSLASDESRIGNQATEIFDLGGLRFASYIVPEISDRIRNVEPFDQGYSQNNDKSRGNGQKRYISFSLRSSINFWQVQYYEHILSEVRNGVKIKYPIVYD